MTSRTVLITGANSGVGLATAKVIACAVENFHVIIASRSLDKANAAKSEIEATGPKNPLSIVQLDVTDDTSIGKAVEFVQQKFGHLDVLVNNAASGNRDDNVRKRFDVVMATNVTGPVVVADAFRPLLLKSPKPYSIYVSSGMGSMARAADPTGASYRSLSNGNAYRASKAALNMVALQEMVEFENTPLKVFAFCPGFVRSNLRGTSEEARSGWGKAGDPERSGEAILGIIRGERDAEVGQFVHKDGVYPW